MGRPTSYAVTDVLKRATELFRRRPFHEVSVQDLVSATGANRFAIYERFGGKDGLFYACLEAYLEGAVKRELLRPLTDEQGGLEALLAVLDWMRARNRDPQAPAGCLIVNASIEFGQSDERVAQVTCDYWAAVRAAIEAALERAVLRGELDCDTSIEQRADYLLTMLDAFMTLRHVSRPSADRVMGVVISELNSWRKAPSKFHAAE